MKAYLINTSVELEIRGFWNKVNGHGVTALMCSCYVKAFDSMEDVPAARIEIR